MRDPQSDPHSNICIDQFGRVRVRFWWDRSWRPWREHKGDSERMTAWLRVAENWADDRWGTMFPPRVGQEVIVSFLNGDPDRPIVTGRVYNGAQPPPFHQPGMQPQPLPPGAMKPESVRIQTQMHYSGIKTQSTPRPKGEARRFHLLRFDDTWKKEQYLIRSQARTDVTTFGSYFDTTGGDRHLTIGGPDGGGNMYVKMFGEYDIHVVKSQFEQIDQNYEMQVTGNTSWMFGGSRSSSVGGVESLLAGGIALSATTNITLLVGASSIVITPAGISISAPVINLVSPVPVLGPAPMLAPGPVALLPLVPSPVVVNAPTDPNGADPGDKP